MSGDVRMHHMGVLDYNSFPRDCDEFSWINDTESNATLLYCPSPTSTVVSVGDWVIGHHSVQLVHCCHTCRTKWQQVILKTLDPVIYNVSRFLTLKCWYTCINKHYNRVTIITGPVRLAAADGEYQDTFITWLKENIWINSLVLSFLLL